MEAAYKATSQAILAMLVCTVSRQESKEAGGQRCIVRYSKQNKSDFEYRYKNSGLELKLHINFIFFSFRCKITCGPIPCFCKQSSYGASLKRSLAATKVVVGKDLML